MYSYEANGRGNTSATDAKLLERKSQFINLPAVTPEDDGTVLGVAEGKWKPVPGGGGASGYDELSGGNITEVDGKKYLTPLGGGAIRNPLDVEFVMTATEDGGITYGEEPITEGELIVGETYQVTVNGVTDDYACYVDEYGLKIIGTFVDDMAVGDWQIAGYDGGIFCAVCGNVNDEFHLEINGTKELVLQVDPAYFNSFVAVKFLVNKNGSTWRITDIHGKPVKNKDLSDGDYIRFVGLFVGHEGIGRFNAFYRKMQFVFRSGTQTSTGAVGLNAYDVHVLDGDDEAFAEVEVKNFYSAIEWSVQ